MASVRRRQGSSRFLRNLRLSTASSVPSWMRVRVRVRVKVEWLVVSVTVKGECQG